jgi:hypothetical protein
VVTGALTVDGSVVATFEGPQVPRATGHVLAVDTAVNSARLLAVADVISCCQSQSPERWLARFPGCAVAVAALGDRLLAVTQPARFFPFNPDDGARDPLIIAILLHAWLSAGHPPSLLDPRPVRTSAWLPRTSAQRSFVLVTEAR